MGLTLDTCNMNLKQCCTNRILFLCVKHQLLVHISSSGISSWKILDESQGVESFEKQHAPMKSLNPQLKTPNWCLQSRNRVNCSEILQIGKRDQANTLRQYQKGWGRNEYTKSMSILLTFFFFFKQHWFCSDTSSWDNLQQPTQHFELWPYPDRQMVAQSSGCTYKTF